MFGNIPVPRKPNDFIKDAIGGMLPRQAPTLRLTGSNGGVPASSIVGSIVSLGDATPFFFVDAEAPELHPMGGIQMHKLHQFHGGGRAIDTYGAAPRPMEFSGQLFTVTVPRLNVNSSAQPDAGQTFTAVQRSQMLDKWRRTGTEVTFRFDKFEYLVVVTSYEGDVHHDNHVSYRISMTIIADNTADAVPTRTGMSANYQEPDPPARTIYDLAQELYQSAKAWLEFSSLAVNLATGLADDLKNNPASILIAGTGLIPGSAKVYELGNKVAALLNSMSLFKETLFPTLVMDLENGKPYEGLTNESIATFLIPEVEAATTAMEGASTFFLDDYAELDSASPEALAATADSAERTRAALNRLHKALAEFMAPEGAMELRLYNPDLYLLAIQYYGDIEEWATIASINGLSDPRPKGQYTIRIPLNADGSGKPTNTTMALEA